MNTKLKMAIVGAGTWGENHAKIYRAHPFADVVAICDMNYGKAKTVADKIGISQVYSDSIMKCLIALAAMQWQS